MRSEKILILKNDRAGDFFTSLKLISTLKNTSKDITIFLSELNVGFSFLLSDIKKKMVNSKLTFFQKIRIF